MINAAGRSEIEVQGEKRRIEGAAGFALAAEVEAQGPIARQREPLLQDERAGIVALAGERADPGALVLEQRFTLTRDMALRFDLSRQRESGRTFDTALLSLHLYF